ncbi:MAG: phosphatidate cytidylyltransferase, partial [Bacteroidales bacterium]|nr:phosphatidate cytidylyltransferase [Bacteroidales bacterium]
TPPPPAGPPPAGGGRWGGAGWGWPFGAAFYGGLPLALLVWLRRVDLIWPLFLVIWANDVFAYLVGSSFKAEKRHKLAPRISPNKSWEGAAGGFCAAVLTGGAWAFFKGTSLASMLVFAAVLSVVGVLGDLLESYYKRRAGIKDSGTVLGGHGGMLDRFDSVLLAAPAAVLLWVIWNGI